MTAKVLVGDCLDVMKGMESNSIDAICTDPPAGINFMNKDFDSDRGGRDAWVAWLSERLREALRLAKPGAHAFVWALPRTSGWTHRAIEDAGWDIRDCATHIFGSGFPKSKNLDGEWEGWGTALKPAAEFWYLARKPLAASGVAANVTQYGTGALNIDGCRIGTDEVTTNGWRSREAPVYGLGHDIDPSYRGATSQGRWPANAIFDEESARLLDEMSGERTSGGTGKDGHGTHTGLRGNDLPRRIHAERPPDTGGPSRFFYTSKSSRAERNKGLAGMPEQPTQEYGSIRSNRGNGYEAESKHGNHHPTVKPVDLMQWLVRLITPKGGTVLDPFMGSGSTGIAADREGMHFIGIEQDPEYAEIARKRIVGDCPLFTTLAAD